MENDGGAVLDQEFELLRRVLGLRQEVVDPLAIALIPGGYQVYLSTFRSQEKASPQQGASDFELAGEVDIERQVDGSLGPCKAGQERVQDDLVGSISASRAKHAVQADGEVPGLQAGQRFDRAFGKDDRGIRLAGHLPDGWRDVGRVRCRPSASGTLGRWPV